MFAKASRPRRLRSLEDRQLDGEDRTLAGRAVEAQRAAHRLGQVLREGQPQSGPFDTGRFDVESVEGNEEPLDHLGTDTESGVTHRNTNHVLDDLRAHRDAALRTVVLDGVGEKIQQYLTEALWVGAHQGIGDVADFDFEAALTRLQGDDS